jgi:hypothetical protein
MRVNKGYICLTVVLLLAAHRIFPEDFGLVINASPEYRGNVLPGEFAFTGSLSPWISGNIRRGLFYYASFSASMDYADDRFESPPFFELGRTELNWRPYSALLLTAGRQYFKDDAEMAVSGLFDGISVSSGFSWGRLSARAFYTGLLYKESAGIIMTNTDFENYHKPLDYSDPESYFASRRMLAAIGAEFPDLTRRSMLNLDLLAQFDLNGTADNLHGQYFLGRYTFWPVETLALNIAGGAALTEVEGADTQISFAGSAGYDWEVSKTFADMLSMEFRYASGVINGTIGPFRPLSGISQGVVITPKLSGIGTAKVSYTVRFHRSFTAAAGFAYFLRTDEETFQDADLDPASESRLLGGEVYGSAVWSPDQLIRLTVEGGVFFPGMGGAFRSDAPLGWKISGGIILSL